WRRWHRRLWLGAGQQGVASGRDCHRADRRSAPREEMIATRWAVLARATVPALAAFGATGTDLQPSALRVAVTAIVGLLAPLFWPGTGATAARPTARLVGRALGGACPAGAGADAAGTARGIVGWSLAAACLAAIALRFAGNQGQPFARILPACAMLM